MYVADQTTRLMPLCCEKARLKDDAYAVSCCTQYVTSGEGKRKEKLGADPSGRATRDSKSPHEAKRKRGGGGEVRSNEKRHWAFG